jgi:hypothetical protein
VQLTTFRSATAFRLANAVADLEVTQTGTAPHARPLLEAGQEAVLCAAKTHKRSCCEPDGAALAWGASQGRRGGQAKAYELAQILAAAPASILARVAARISPGNGSQARERGITGLEAAPWRS